MGYEPIDAEYEAQMDAIYDGVMEHYYGSDAYAEDLNRGIEEFTTERQRSYYVENTAVAESAFNLLAEARELFHLGHYGASQVMAEQPQSLHSAMP
jgi:DNA-binding MurR/RpiR family transcriptional regulator